MIILRLKKLFIINRNENLFIILTIIFLYYKYTRIGDFIYDYMMMYFTFILFYLVFRNFRINMNILSIILVLIHYLDVVSVYTSIIVPFGMFIYEKDSFIIFGNLIPRPLGIFTNSTMTSVFYFIMITLTPNKMIRLLLMSCVITFFSGTGIIMLFGYIIFLNFSFIKLVIALPIFILASQAIGKISLMYIAYNITSKYELLLNTLSEMKTHELLFGIDRMRTLSDFGFLQFLSAYGICGMLLIGFFFISKINPENRLPLILIIFVSFIHYPFTAYALGSLVLGYVLSRGVNTYRMRPVLVTK